MTRHLGNPPPPTLRGPLLRAAGLTMGLVLAATATVTADGATWFGVRGPRCPLDACLGPTACPACGLVRATAAAVQGDLAFSIAAHPAGPVVALLLLGGAALHFDIVRRRRELPGHRTWRRFGHRTFAAAVVTGWLLRFLLP